MCISGDRICVAKDGLGYVLRRPLCIALMSELQGWLLAPKVTGGELPPERICLANTKRMHAMRYLRRPSALCPDVKFLVHPYHVRPPHFHIPPSSLGIGDDVAPVDVGPDYGHGVGVAALASLFPSLLRGYWLLSFKLASV